MVLNPERGLQLLIFIVMFALVYIVVSESKKKGPPEVRKLPQFEAIDELVGRCAETNTKLHFTTGYGGGGLATRYGPSHLAGLSILGYTARNTARRGVSLIFTTPFQEVVPVAEDIIRYSYIAEGEPEVFNIEMCRYISGASLAYAQGVAGIMSRERVGANIMVGNFWSEGLIIAESASMAGAMQIGGAAPEMANQSALVVACDYCFLGEEVFAAGAYASEEPYIRSRLRVQDWCKFASVGLILLGTILAILGLPWTWMFEW